MKILRIITLCTICMCACFVLTAGIVQAEEKRIGFLDLSKTFDGYGKTKDYDSVLEGEHKAYEKERNAKIEQLKEKQGKLALLQEAERAKLQREVVQMQEDLKNFDQGQRTDLTKRRDERLREILLEIEKVVSDFAKKEKYDVILNDRVLIFGSDALNVTDQILKILNDDYNKK